MGIKSQYSYLFPSTMQMYPERSFIVQTAYKKSKKPLKICSKVDSLALPMHMTQFNRIIIVRDARCRRCSNWLELSTVVEDRHGWKFLLLSTLDIQCQVAVSRVLRICWHFASDWLMSFQSLCCYLSMA